MIRAILFDFDGVIADSETLANTVLAEAVTNLGLPTTRDEAIARYMGKRWSDIVAVIEQEVGRTLRKDFSDELTQATLNRFRTDLREVNGVKAFLHHFQHLPWAIASSSSLKRILFCLEVLGLEEAFAGRVFSAELVTRGKPHPDIFLYAAERLGVPPVDCIVIEDSPGGVRAGTAAGMTVIGLHAGSHCSPGHEQKLKEAGAAWTAASWKEVSAIVNGLIDGAVPSTT